MVPISRVIPKEVSCGANVSRCNRLYWFPTRDFVAASKTRRYQIHARILASMNFAISLTLKNARNYNFLGWGEFFQGFLNL